MEEGLQAAAVHELIPLQAVHTRSKTLRESKPPVNEKNH
jgi:hypothetical protein